MAQHSTTTDPTLDTLALAFVVQVQGSWTDKALEALRATCTKEGITPTASEFETALVQARQRFEAGAAQLFVCTGRPCHKRAKFDMSDPALQRAAATCGLQVSATACQGPCKQAPIATLRVGQRCDMFAQFRHEADWQAVVDFTKRATAIGTLLVDPGAAQAFQFDPVHDHEKTSVAMQKLQFLLGHFRGDAPASASHIGAFQKEMLGTWEAAGRCMAFRMGVTFPLADGSKDTHVAFVTAAVNPDTDHLEARAYTDGGAIYDYQLRFDGDTVLFADNPGEHMKIQSARKLLTPTDYGFEERVEIDHGSGQFEPHYVIAMHRVTHGSNGA